MALLSKMGDFSAVRNYIGLGHFAVTFFFFFPHEVATVFSHFFFTFATFFCNHCLSQKLFRDFHECGEAAVL